MIQHKLSFVLDNSFRYIKCTKCNMPNVPTRKVCITCEEPLDVKNMATKGDFKELKEGRELTTLILV